MPKSPLRSSDGYLKRNAARRICGALLQEPPRRTRTLQSPPVIHALAPDGAPWEACLRALLRRSRTVDGSDLPRTVGDLEIYPDEGVVTKGGDELHLTKTEFRLLCELSDNPGKVLSREQLLERVWGYDYFGDGRLVDVHVRRLRLKIEDDPASPRYVATARGLGYKLRA